MAWPYEAQPSCRKWVGVPASTDTSVWTHEPNGCEIRETILFTRINPPLHARSSFCCSPHKDASGDAGWAPLLDVTGKDGGAKGEGDALEDFAWPEMDYAWVDMTEDELESLEK